MSDAQLLATTTAIKVGRESFEFSIPSIAQRLKLGTRARTIRRHYDPQGFGDEWGLDDETATLAWGIAAFEVLLTGCDASANWPYSKDEKGAPTVDHTKWPDGKEEIVLEAARKLREELRDFERVGLPTNSPLAMKLWRVADIQGHRDPFSERMLSMSLAQLDFVLECYAADHPSEYTFNRGGVEVPAPAQATANWFNVLRGRALEQFMSGRINHAVSRARKAQATVFGIRGVGKDTIAGRKDKGKA